MKRKAKFDLSMPIPQKLQRTQEIIDSIGTNTTVFVTPSPPLVDVQSAKDDLSKAYNAALDGGGTAKAEQRTANENLNNVLRPLRDYVNEVANGNEDTVFLSGFEASKIPSPIGPMPPVVIKSGKGGDGDGSVSLNWSVVYGAQNYVVEMSTDGVVFTKEAFPTKSRVKITGLAIGQFYWFRVAANGAAGLGPFGPAMKVLAS